MPHLVAMTEPLACDLPSDALEALDGEVHPGTLTLDAIDRDWRDLLEDYGVENWGFGSDPTWDIPESDVDEINQMLREAGYPARQDQSAITW